MRRSPTITVLCGLFLGFIVQVFGQTTTVRPPTLYGVVGAGTVELGQRVTLSVSMDAQTGATYQYQWRKSSVDIPGATLSTYVIEAATAADAGTYTVRVTNSAGESAASGNITVRPAAAPVITTQPRSTSAQVGQTITFTYLATGSYPRTHQWSKDGSPIPGATAATLELANLTTASVGSYTVAISNSLGSVTSNAALLTVNAATPLVLSSTSPSSGTYTEGTAVDLHVSIQSGSSPYTYQWFKDGNPLEGATATSNPLRFTAITLAHAGTYSVRVSNILGSVTSRNATITVTAATPATINSHPRAVAVFEGESASFSVSASGTSLRYQWYKDDVAISNATSSSYYISEVRSADVGSYSVAVSNIKGSVTSSPALLTIKAPVAPAITTQPIDRDVTEGNSTSFSVVASGSPTLRYQWYFNGTPLASSATSSSYSFTPTLLQAGNYHVVVTNPAGSVTSRTAKLSIAPQPPPPVVRLSNVTATLGSSFSISTYVGSSSGATSFQWYKNGAPIADATRESYSVSSAKPDDAGDYIVVITNSSGSTTSRVARVTVVQPSGSGAQTGAWIGAARSGNIVYFAFANPARVERFDIVNERWLSALPLPRAPSAFAVGPGGIYTAAGSIVYRYTLEGTGETILNSAFATNVVGLMLWRDFLLVSSAGYRLTSLRVADGATVASRSYSYYWGANMAVTSGGQAFSRTAGISPSDIVTATVQADGSLSASSTDSRYHGDYPDASRVFVSPDDRYVADD
ncbi:MAG TPA: immunoglobulin domain-containing protein, partial [Opitutaceae bacterium]